MKSKTRVLTRSKHGLVTGTLRGFADYYGLSLTKLQLVFLIAACFGVGLVAYFALWLSIPGYSQRARLLQELEAEQQ